MKRAAAVLGPLVGLFTTAALAQDATTAGEVTTPYPTFHNVSIEWAITGDDNDNGSVGVRYRKQGDTTYREGLPLFRVPAGSNQGFSWTNKHAGSVFNVAPATTYEIELTLTDPDGGDATETLTVTTRALPVTMAGAPETTVTPETIDGALADASPGDVLVLGDGTYGEIQVPNDGAEGMPIVLRAARRGGAIVEGDVRIDGRSFVHVEDLVVHGKFKFNDAASIVVRGCDIETPENGIISYGTGVSNAYILDNVIHGPTIWMDSALGVDGDNLGEGVQLTGPGNVIAFNRISGFRDCVSLLEDSEAVNQLSIDIYGNDLSECADDAIEADFAMGNVRVYQNRISNSFMGISSQPGLGGPTYFIRNVMYNAMYQSFKLQRSSVGDVGYHNTVIKSGDAFSVNTTDTFSHATFRNNLFIGGPGGVYGGYDSGAGEVMYLPSADGTCSFDYDGYASIGTGTFSGEVGGVDFNSLQELTTNTTEEHAVEVALDTFAASIPFPAEPFNAAPPPSFALATSGSSVDKGLALANINDGFAGTAPDLGAVELGASETVYGPGGSLGGDGDGDGDDDDGSGGSGGMDGDGGAASGGGPSGGASNDGGSGGADGEKGEDGCDCQLGGARPRPAPAIWALVFGGLLLARRKTSRLG